MKSLYESILDDEEILIDKTKKTAGGIFDYMRVNNRGFKRCYEELNNVYIDWFCDYMPCLKKYKNLKIRIVDSWDDVNTIALYNSSGMIFFIRDWKDDKKFHVHCNQYNKIKGFKVEFDKFMKEFGFTKDIRSETDFYKNY